MVLALSNVTLQRIGSEVLASWAMDLGETNPHCLSKLRVPRYPSLSHIGAWCCLLYMILYPFTSHLYHPHKCVPYIGMVGQIPMGCEIPLAHWYPSRKPLWFGSIITTKSCDVTGMMVNVGVTIANTPLFSFWKKQSDKSKSHPSTKVVFTYNYIYNYHKPVKDEFT